LYPKDENMMKFIDELLIKIFEAEKTQRKLYLTLLPEEMAINNRVLSLCFKVVKDSKDEDINDAELISWLREDLDIRLAKINNKSIYTLFEFPA